MKAVGIIAEYNPFHNGHQWHLEKARSLAATDYSIAVMSGNFMQRGEPAIFDKWSRAQMAVSSGIDLIVELPVAFSVRSAEYFAAGGIRLLHALGIVSHICFGAEHANLTILSTIADALNVPEVLDALHQNLESGYSYAAAWGQALENHLGVSREVVSSPNNLLAIEYLRAIKTYAPSLIPLVIARRQAGYHDMTISNAIASATAIRAAFCHHSEDAWSALPPPSRQIIENLFAQDHTPISFSHYEQLVLASLRKLSLSELAVLPDVGEGLEYKIKNAALRAGELEELIRCLKTRRYSRTRLQRILTHALLGTNKHMLREFDREGPLYARILCFNEKGRDLLRHIKQKSSLPLITKTTHYLTSKKRDTQQLSPLEAMLALDTIATDIYVLGMANPKWRHGGLDFHRSVQYLPSAKDV
ncbi:MAG: hypothetical protein H6Q67_77 [Firmicutes bacterium]|nr:hypothetical protein [Bacillota bacterium]